MYRIFEGGILKPIIVEAWGDDEFGKELIRNFDKIAGMRFWGERMLTVEFCVPKNQRNRLIRKFHRVATKKYNLSNYYVCKIMSIFFPLSERGVKYIINNK